MNHRASLAAARAVAAVAAVTATLAATSACQVVEPAPLPHSEDIPVRKQSVSGILYGAHRRIACEGCHIDQEPPYAAVADDCLGCHKADRRKLHPQGRDHQADAKTCGGSGCHSVGHLDWSDWIEGTAPVTETGTTLPETGTDTGTTDDCLLGPTSAPQSCSRACHGETFDNAAPADDVHAVHTGAPEYAGDLIWAPLGQTNDCATCHPAGNDAAPTHWDCVNDVPMTGLATQADYAVSWAQSNPPVLDPGPPAYDPSTSTCSNIYCHGYGMTEQPPDPVWTNPVAGDCGSCHGIGPDFAEHPSGNDCSGCHGTTTTGDPAQIDDASYHVNGKLWLFQGEQ